MGAMCRKIKNGIGANYLRIGNALHRDACTWDFMAKSIARHWWYRRRSEIISGMYDY